MVICNNSCQLDGLLCVGCIGLSVNYGLYVGVCNCFWKIFVVINSFAGLLPLFKGYGFAVLINLSESCTWYAVVYLPMSVPAFASLWMKGNSCSLSVGIGAF